MALTQNGSQDGKPKKDVAVYVDYENLYISLRSTVGQNPNFDVIMDKCREFGRLTICRAYADWSEFARVVTSQMFSSGVEPIFVPTRKFYDAKTRSQATKNSVDIVITIDIMKDVLQSKNIDIFCLVSGDRDFVPLMNQIRAAGKEVYAIGVAGCTSSELAVAVDEMFYYHQLLETEEDLAAEQKDVYAKLLRAVEIARARGYRATLGVVKPILRELVVGFDERKFRNSKGVPFLQFKQFVREAERQGFIRVAEAGENFELFLATENIIERRPAKEPRDASQQRRQGPPQQRGPQPQQAQAAGATDDESAPEAAAEAVETVAVEGDESAAGEKGGGRRRGRRGGRGRRRRGPGGEAVAGAEASDASDTESDSDEDREAEDGADAVEAAAPDAEIEPETVEAEIVEEAPRAAAPASRRGRGGNGNGAAHEESRRERPSRAAQAAPAAQAAQAESAGGDEESDEDEEAALAALEDRSLPDQAMGDLESIMKTFSGRAPSQRRLIARLKKGATSGELQGEYREGQFLLLVRKAIQEGFLEKVSKGFYAGLRWNDDRPSA